MTTTPSWIHAAHDGCLLTIKVTPRASQTKIAGVDAAWLRIRLQAPPVDGRANEALTAFLADQLNLSRHAVGIVAGETGRIKKVRVAGLTVAGVRKKLGV